MTARDDIMERLYEAIHRAGKLREMADELDAKLLLIQQELERHPDGKDSRTHWVGGDGKSACNSTPRSGAWGAVREIEKIGNVTCNDCLAWLGDKLLTKEN